ETAGLYVGIVHGGVFGERDAARRGAHLSFVCRQLERPDVWLATTADVARWWASRERLAVRVVADRIVVTNHGRLPVAAARVLVARAKGTVGAPVPVLHPGQSIPRAHPERGRPGVEAHVQEAW